MAGENAKAGRHQNNCPDADRPPTRTSGAGTQRFNARSRLGAGGCLNAGPCRATEPTRHGSQWPGSHNWHRAMRFPGRYWNQEPTRKLEYFTGRITVDYRPVRTAPATSPCWGRFTYLKPVSGEELRASLGELHVGWQCPAIFRPRSATIPTEPASSFRLSARSIAESIVAVRPMDRDRLFSCCAGWPSW